MLHVKNLAVQLVESGKHIFHDVSFSLTPGNIYTITGSNGTGKTILLKSLSSLLNESSFNVTGEILFRDKNIYQSTPEELRRIRRKYIRYVFQDEANAFDPLRKFEYYFNKRILNDIGSIEKVFNRLLLSPPSKFLNSFPYEVSTGQIQRIGFALAILSNPKLIILDEPTSAIDPINANLYKHILHDFVLSSENSVLMVTHDHLFAEKVTDYIAELNNGSLSPFNKINAD